MKASHDGGEGSEGVVAPYMDGWMENQRDKLFIQFIKN
jgi:hypothetical protein